MQLANTIAQQVIGRLASIERLLADANRLRIDDANSRAAHAAVAAMFSVTSSPSIQCLRANQHRRGCQIGNVSASAGIILGIALGVQAIELQGSGGTIMGGIQLSPGQWWNGMIGNCVWTGSVYLISSSDVPPALAAVIEA